MCKMCHILQFDFGHPPHDFLDLPHEDLLMPSTVTPHPSLNPTTPQCMLFLLLTTALACHKDKTKKLFAPLELAKSFDDFPNSISV